MYPAIQYGSGGGNITLSIAQTAIDGLAAASPAVIYTQYPDKPLYIHSIFGTINLKNAGVADASIDSISFVDGEANPFATLGPQWIPAGKTISVNFCFVVDLFASALGDTISAVIALDIANLTVETGSEISVTVGGA